MNPLKIRNSMKIDEDFRLFLEVYHCFAFLAELKLNGQDGRDNNRGHQKQNRIRVRTRRRQVLLLGGIGRVITGGSYGTNDRINSFIKAGNKVILDDVMGRIADLASGGIVTGAEAKAWDAQTLSNEQNAIQPLYGSMLTSDDINILNNNVELNYGNNWDSSWSVSNQRHRWALGMRVMGYEGTKPEDMPKPTN